MEASNPMPSEPYEVEPGRDLGPLLRPAPVEVIQDVYGVLLQRLAKASDLSQYDGVPLWRRSRSRYAPSGFLFLL
jgi:hypothetical protein